MWQSFLHFKAPVMNYYAFNRIELIPAAYFGRSRPHDKRLFWSDFKPLVQLPLSAKASIRILVKCAMK